MNSLPLAALLAIFVAAAAAVWMAGSRLSTATNVIDTRLGLGEAFGGLILLAIVTNLPEIAIVVSAALTHQMGIAVGNILGGIARLIEQLACPVGDLAGHTGPVERHAGGGLGKKRGDTGGTGQR